MVVNESTSILTISKRNDLTFTKNLFIFIWAWGRTDTGASLQNLLMEFNSPLALKCRSENRVIANKNKPIQTFIYILFYIAGRLLATHRSHKPRLRWFDSISRNKVGDSQKDSYGINSESCKIRMPSRV